MSEPVPTSQPALPIWTCDILPSKAENAVPLESLTVGAKFHMSCKGDIPVEWAEGPLQVQFAKKEETYILAVLKAEQLESTRAELMVTSYKPGEHKPEYVRIVQGTQGFEVSKPTWTIQSVLKKEEQPQAFPPFGPWSLGFPLWIIIAVATVLGLLAFFIFRKSRRHIQRRRMLEELARHTTALTPINQFYRDARQLRRRLNTVKTAEELKPVAEDLNREFRLYVLRRFQIPTLDWSDRAIVEDLRKRHRKVYEQAGDSLKKTLRELSRLGSQPQVKPHDVEQLHQMSVQTAEKVEEAVEVRK